MPNPNRNGMQDAIILSKKLQGWAAENGKGSVVTAAVELLEAFRNQPKPSYYSRLSTDDIAARRDKLAAQLAKLNAELGRRS